MFYDIFYDKLEKSNSYVTSVKNDVLDVIFHITLLVPVINFRVPDFILNTREVI